MYSGIITGVAENFENEPKKLLIDTIICYEQEKAINQIENKAPSEKFDYILKFIKWMIKFLWKVDYEQA